MLPQSSGSKNKQNVKADGKQSSRLVEISGSKKEMEDKTVPAALTVGHNKPPVAIVSHTEQSQSTGDKNRIADLILKMEAICSSEK
jgi:hypothetical protein